MPLAEKVPIYNDLYLRLALALLSAHLIVSFGAEESFFRLLVSWFYYRDLLLSFVISFLLITEVYLITSKLDKYYDWRKYTAERIGLQLVAGLIFPALSAFLLAAGYFALFGINILKTHYPDLIFPVVVIMILLLNVYYLAFYFYRRWQLAENQLPVNPVTEKNKEVIVVHKGTKIIPLPVEMISYIYHDGEYNFLRTFDREDYLLSQPLDELQQQLQAKQFFRANRQIIVNFSACRHFEAMDFGKLKLLVHPEIKSEIIISQKRAKQFKEWISR